MTFEDGLRRRAKPVHCSRHPASDFRMRLRPRILFVSAVLLELGQAWAAPPPVVAPRVIDEPIWVYPHKAERVGLRRGEARAMLSISDQGELLDFLVIGCTHVAFAEEVVAAMPQLRFSPAKVRGEPATVRMPFSFYFQQEGTIASLSAMDQWEAQMARLSPQDEFRSWLCPARELDRPLTPLKVFSPRYPEEMRSRGEDAVVEIDFFVDGAGRVRLPAVDVGRHPSFAREAVAALTAWTFEPPTRGGQPVIVRASQRFHFGPPEPDKPDRK
jgi:TonB family protein